MTILLDSLDEVAIQNGIDYGFCCADASGSGEYCMISADKHISYRFIKDGRLIINTVTGSEYHFSRNKTATPFMIWFASPIIQMVWEAEYPEFAEKMKRYENKNINAAAKRHAG